MDSNSKPIFSIQLSFDDEDDEGKLDEPNCLCGCLRITSALKLIAAFHLIFDLIALCAAWDIIFVYLFTFYSIGTFTMFCMVISGLQEEKRKKIRYTKVWLAFKLIITIALILAIAIGLFEGDFDFLNTLQLDTNTILLIVCTVILMPMGIVQWYWTDETIRYLAIRDDIYTIPSGKFKWRPEILRPHEIKHERF